MKIICKNCNGLKIDIHNRWYRFFIPPWILCQGHVGAIKVSDLECISKDDLDDEDVIMISDMSEKKSKQIKIGELIEFIKTKI